MTNTPDAPALKDCDLIMKGGITSGIVYPSVILKLKERYQFRSIGGASAGAIGAAFAAAAELGRDTGGFPKLEARRQQLATGPFLKNLFQPTDQTRPLLDAAYDALVLKGDVAAARRAGRLGQGTVALVRFLAPRVLRLVRRNARAASTRGAAIALGAAAVVAAVAAVCVVTAGALLGNGPPAGVVVLGALLFIAVLALLALPLGALAGGAAGLARSLSVEVPGNFFGLCNGGPGSPGVPALTDWIHESIQDLAGRATGPPLTFGDLAERHIQLRMMTTNLSHSQGYQLPDLGAAPAGTNATFAFREDEFRRLFPASVVDAMAAAPARTLHGLRLPEGWFAMPLGPRLPVVVATRMSLSFPVLVSAVPLYTVRRDAVDRLRRQGGDVLDPDDLQCNWFSDGGIASNFPIHFFDNWLPGCPTFGIQLTDLPPESFAPAAAGHSETVSGRYVSAVTDEMPVPGPASVDEALDKAVYLPRGDEVLEPEWHPIDGWGGFAMAIFTTLHDAHDNMQSSLPGYRERVVQVRLASDEGGLNLAMPASTIDQVMAKGEAAGDKILRYFDMDHHRWVRFRVLMAELERNLGLVEQRVAGKLFDVDTLFAAAVRPPAPDGAGFPYPRDCAWCDDARLRLGELRRVVQHWGGQGFFGQCAPVPSPALRVVPRE